MGAPQADPNWLPEVKKFWRTYLKDFSFEVDEKEMLKIACHSYNRMLEAKKLLDAEGLTFTMPSGAVRKHPASDVEKHSRAALLQALKVLNSKKPKKVPKKMGRPSSAAVLGM
jgi:P27 family predicted phage terminase small subunit